MWWLSAAAFGLTTMINQAAIRARSWLFTPATRPDRFAKAAAAGAYASKGGKSIIAATSTAAHGKISRIVPRLQGPVTTPRIDTHYVVTEFGSANLKGRSSTERAHALIGLAHPEFRDEAPCIGEEAASRLRRGSDWTRESSLSGRT
jgi:hypothetical protein